VIVFGIADRERVAGRQAQRLQSGVQAGALADALRHRHDAALVEDQHQGELKGANHVEDGRRVPGVGVNERLPRMVRDAAP